MIELNTEYSSSRKPHKPGSLPRNRLRFSFPEVHPQARFDLEFQRTLRIPDDGNDYPLPPGLGRFPLRHVDDFADRIPAPWREHGGVMLPMFQSEAMWINFDSPVGYPFLVKIAAGKINAVTGESWEDVPHQDPQDYLVIPDQPWLDGFCVEKDLIRQFVAAPLGSGYTVEEQITGEGAFGGLQIIAFPMKAEEWEKHRHRPRKRMMEIPPDALKCMASPDMGLAMGGCMEQKIDRDPYDFSVWDLEHRSRCYVHLANSISWRAITGEAPPTMPPTAEHYSEHGLPWFEYYSEAQAVEGSKILEGVRSVAEMDVEKPRGTGLLPENRTPDKVTIVRLGNKPGVVREF